MAKETLLPDPTADPRIRVVGLSMVVHGSTIIAEHTYDIRCGEVIGVMGDSQARKTTLLELLAGKIQPTSGSVIVMGLDRWEQNNEIRKRTTFLPKAVEHHLGDTPYEHLKALSQLYRMRNRDFQSRGTTLCREMQITKILHSPWPSLTLSEWKQVDAVGAFLPPADVRILDQPFNRELTTPSLIAIYSWIMMARNAGETILFSTQAPIFAYRFSDRLLTVVGYSAWLMPVDDSPAIPVAALQFPHSRIEVPDIDPDEWEIR